MISKAQVTWSAHRGSGLAPMKIDEILAALRDERRQLDEVILSLERTDHGKDQLKRLGRPPGTKNKPKILPRLFD
jgi:hypothetical protein